MCLCMCGGCCMYSLILPYLYHIFSSVQSLSHVRLFVTPWICSTLGLPVHHQLPEYTQTHVHRVGDAIQPSHPLSSSSPPAPNPSQHQGLFQWVNSLHEVAKVLEFQLSISPSNENPGLISFRMDWLDHTVQKHQFFSTQLSSQSNCHIHTWPLEKP